MEILRSIPELSRLPGPLFLAIGVFDGVHRGHQAVISTSAQHAESPNGTPVVVTFDPHPMKVLRPTEAPHLLTATQHKIKLIRSLGVQHLLVIKFDSAFAATAPEDFVRQLVTHSKPLREICVGHEWSFGKGRRGNLALLRKLGAQFDFEVVGIPAVTLPNGEIVSSTAIRQAIQAGDFAKAAQMLGREYTILGTVVRGEHFGKKIGFPTANLSAHSEQFPPNGVYFAYATLDGMVYPGVVNLGYRPTVSSKSERVLEIHLLDFNRDVYGKDLEVRFVRYLRPEQKFESVDALAKQIAFDVQQAREIRLA
jgi:riboflavin kinase / FMN adenylyltransferase